jgi:protein-arginine kinase activator protein McsA
MLCEKCKKIEATVHVTRAVAGSGETQKRNLCEACFRESDLAKGIKTAGWTSYEPTTRPRTSR